MTLREALRKVYPDHATRIEEIIHNQEVMVSALDTKADPDCNTLLLTSFVWANTNEGYDYWQLLARNVEG